MKSKLIVPEEYRRILKPIHDFSKARKIKLYLVGGILRDLILGREKENLDFDFCLKKSAINFGRKLAKEIRAGFVVLDREHGACRLVKKMKNKACTLDFTDFRGKTLEEDLLRRDFAINSLGLELEKIFSGQEVSGLLIDHCLAQKALRNKTINVVNKRSFAEDPLRILRAFSLSCVLGFEIEKKTLQLAGGERNKLLRVSSERVRDELFKIFDSACAYQSIVSLDKWKILKVIIPEIEKMRNVGGGPYHHLKVLAHSLETVRQLDGLVKELKRDLEIQDYLFEIISGGRRRLALIKFAALLHDIGKPAARKVEGGKTKFHGHERIGLRMAESIAKRLRLSNDEINALKTMVLWHLRPGYLAGNQKPTKKAVFRFFRDTGNEAIAVLLLSLADQRATKGRLTTKDSHAHHEKIASGLIKEYFRRKKEKRPVRLINGDILLERFKLEPSPLIGKILSEIEELQAIGKVKTGTQALEEAKRIIKERSSG